MSQMCSRCGELQYRLEWRDGKGFGTDCGCLHRLNARNSVNDPYAGLVLEHVRDENGKPIQVNSLREMSKAEERYKFQHAVTSYGENYVPPDQKKHTFESGLYQNLRDRRDYVRSRLVERGVSTKYLR